MSSRRYYKHAAFKSCVVIYYIIYFHCSFVTITAESKPLDSAPKQSQFFTMVIKRIPAKWHTFGVNLDIDLAILDGFNKPNHEGCFMEVYKTWKSNAKRPFTWRTVLTVLKDMDEKSLMHEIEHLLDNETAR